MYFFTTKDTGRSKDPERIKGTGLGLFLVREIIRRFGGSLRVESEIGKGSTFHVIFPAQTDHISTHEMTNHD